MEKIAMISGYSADDRQREKLYPLFETVFGIEVDLLKHFYQRGFWDPTYCPYTLFAGEKAVANVSWFSLPLLVDQKVVRAAGIQSVMTHPDYRGRGFMKRLFSTMLADIDQQVEISLLFTESPELYQSYGFRTVPEYTITAPFSHQPGDSLNGLRKLDFFNDDDVKLMGRLLQKHTPICGHFAPVSHASSFFLNMYSPYYQQKLFVAEELSIILVYEVVEETLRLYDCIGETIPPLEALCACIPEPFHQVEFYFYPDRFNVASFRPVASSTGSYLMVRGPLAIAEGTCKWPATATF